jgi:hypothetical protein
VAVLDEVWEVADNWVGFEAMDGGFLGGTLIFEVKVEEKREEKTEE